MLVRMWDNFALVLELGAQSSASSRTRDLEQSFPIRTSRPINNTHKYVLIQEEITTLPLLIVAPWSFVDWQLQFCWRTDPQWDSNELWSRYQVHKLTRRTPRGPGVQSPCPERRYVIITVIKNWIIGWCNSRAFIGLAIMGYEPLYHALQIWCAILTKTIWEDLSIFWGVFHEHIIPPTFVEYEMIIANSD